MNYIRVSDQKQSSLDVLQNIYRDDARDDKTRMDAAKAALPYEHPRQSVTKSRKASGDDEADVNSQLQKEWVQWLNDD